MIDAFNSLLVFLTSMYYEQDESVRPMIDKHLGQSFSLREEHILKGIDESRFKPGVEPKLVTQMLTWLSAGITDQWCNQGADTLDELITEFNTVIDMLKNNLYKEDFL